MNTKNMCKVIEKFLTTHEHFETIELAKEIESQLKADFIEQDYIHRGEKTTERDYYYYTNGAQAREAEIEALKAENEKLTEQLKNAVVLPCKVGDTVYAIAKCCDVARKLDGSYYSSDGSPGTATGWYCAFDGKEDKCPLCDEKCNEKDYAIFETEVLDLNYCENSECNGWQIYLENLDTYESYYFTKPEAKARLKELETENDRD